MTVASLIFLLILGSLVIVSIFARQSSLLARDLQAKEQRLTALLHDYRNQQVEAGLILAFSGQMEQTTEIADNLEEILSELDPDYQYGAATSLLKGIAHFYLGEEDEARRQLDLAVALDPEAIAPNAIRAVAAVYRGDWAAYLDNVPKLADLEVRMPLDEIFLWYGKLYIAPQVAADALREIVPMERDSIFGQALLAATLAHAAVDSGKRTLVDEAFERMERAKSLGADSPLVDLIDLYVHDAAIQLAKLEGDDVKELVDKGDVLAARLAANTEYLVGRYEVALFYENTDRPEAARPHWQACNMVRDACAIFERDGDIKGALKYLDAREDSRYVRLTRLVLQIGTEPAEKILRRYRMLVDQERDVAFRIDALEVPLRLGHSDMARQDALAILQKSEEYGEVGLWVRPLAAYLADDPRGVELEDAAEDASSRYSQIHARFWIGLKHLSKRDRERAVEYFEKCLDTGAFDYSYYGFAKALLERLKKPNWPQGPDGEKTTDVNGVPPHRKATSEESPEETDGR